MSLRTVADRIEHIATYVEISASHALKRFSAESLIYSGGSLKRRGNNISWGAKTALGQWGPGDG